MRIRMRATTITTVTDRIRTVTAIRISRTMMTVSPRSLSRR